MSIVVCMATCNGSRWLSSQLDSLADQTDQDWRLLVSDDQSSDGTAELLQRYQRRDPRIEVLPPRSGAPGAVANFEYLLETAVRRGEATDCVVLSDQDDIWKNEKLALQRRALLTAQGCHSDLALVDERDREIAPSLHAQLHAPARPSVAGLLAQNSVVGCSLALRPTVLDLALPFPGGLMNHDWWLALCALVLGDLEYIDKPLVRYRQHAGNVIGAYRPVRQLLRLPALLARQRSVLQGQLRAVAALLERLECRGVTVPDALRMYLERVGGESLLQRQEALATGDFAAPHKPLRYLRCTAALQTLR